ncbi:MAG: hypothetical protein JXQ29_15895 [Planctomycetes bacterium]|nr:hypothetical protein [Planctomycetota bacterium]
MNRLITLLVIMANICAGALLAFHLFGWMSVSPAKVREAIGYSTAGAVAIALLSGVASDVFNAHRRPFGIAIFLCAVWVGGGPVMGIPSLPQQVRSYFPKLIENSTVVLCLYLLLLSRLAVFGQRQPLGHALALLVTAILAIEARLLGGPVYDDVYYFGVVSMMTIFTLVLGLGGGYQTQGSWAICILLALGGAYHVLT